MAKFKNSVQSKYRVSSITGTVEFSLLYVINISSQSYQIHKVSSVNLVRMLSPCIPYETIVCSQTSSAVLSHCFTDSTCARESVFCLKARAIN